MIYLILYDQRGQCQRVASVATRSQAQVFLDAGFVEGSRQEYNHCAAFVEPANRSDLAAIGIAGSLLSAIANRVERALLGIYEPDRPALATIQNELDRRMATITQDYLAGAINLDQWQRQMQDNINAGNTAGRILGVNGQQNMTQADIQAIERANETQAQFLNRFRRELEAGNGSLSDNQIIARARQYSRSNTSLFENGYTFAVLGLQLPYQPTVLSCCGIYCKCHWVIAHLGGNNFDCTWTLGLAEHCPTCLAREAALNPLQIRNGVIQPFNPSGLEDTPYEC
jgi:hypothetical protein